MTYHSGMSKRLQSLIVDAADLDRRCADNSKLKLRIEELEGSLAAVRSDKAEAGRKASIKVAALAEQLEAMATYRQRQPYTATNLRNKVETQAAEIARLSIANQELVDENARLAKEGCTATHVLLLADVRARVAALEEKGGTQT